MIAYLVSLYPALSHTFIEREVYELTVLGLDVLPFSVRKPDPEKVPGEFGRQELKRVRWLVPASFFSLCTAALWALFTRPVRTARTFRKAVFPAEGVREKLKWTAYFGEAVLLARQLSRSKARQLHCHFGNAGSNVAWLAGDLARLPVSYSFHGIDLDEPVRFRHAEKVRDSAFCVCISEHGRKVLLASAGREAASKIHVVRCGYTPPPEDELKPPPGRNRIVCVARLSEEKGHKVLLEALDMLKHHGVAFECELLGDGPLRGEIAAMIEARGLTEQVVLAGAVSPDEVAHRLDDADVSVLASYGEGIPLALIEAFAHERPVVATRVGGIGELVTDGENGRLVPAGDAEALAEALAGVLADAGRARLMGFAGRLRMLSLHDPVKAAETLKNLFDGVALREEAKAKKSGFAVAA